MAVEFLSLSVTNLALGPRPTDTTMRFFSAVLVRGCRFVWTTSHAVQETSNDKLPIGCNHTRLREDEVRNEHGMMVSAKFT